VKRLLAVVVVVVLAGVAAPSMAAPPPGAEACPMFPADSFWHADVRSLPVHERSSAWLTAMGGPSRRLHPDFGDSGGAQPYGIPYAVVDSSKPRVSATFDYARESDPGPYPFGPDVPVEGGSDRHALMVDRDRCELSELFAVDWNGGSPTAGSGAIWDLRLNALRPAGWTSADAAGLAILPGLLRRDEVLAGRIDHPIRMTASRTDRSYLWPARHHAGAARDQNLPPMGAWFRLRGDYPTAGLHPHTQVILEAFKTHGLILADNGSNWYFTGAADAGWESRVLSELKALTAGSFEAVDTSSLMVHPDSGQIRGASAAPAPAPTSPPSTTAPTTAAPAPTAPPTTEPGGTALPRAPRRADIPASAPQPPAAPTSDTTLAPVEETTTTTSAAAEPATASPSTTSGQRQDAIAVSRFPDARDEGAGPRWLLLLLAPLAAAGGALVWRRRRRAPARS
jgi:hypothetical protein